MLHFFSEKKVINQLNIIRYYGEDYRRVIERHSIILSVTNMIRGQSFKK